MSAATVSSKNTSVSRSARCCRHTPSLKTFYDDGHLAVMNDFVDTEDIASDYVPAVRWAGHEGRGTELRATLRAIDSAWPEGACGVSGVGPNC